jgi:hypothetical protein
MAMGFELMRDRVEQAIAWLERRPDRDSDDLVDAVEECLRRAMQMEADGMNLRG